MLSKITGRALGGITEITCRRPAAFEERDMRLTKKLEDESRYESQFECEACSSSFYMKELLQEIDALRDDYKNSLQDTHDVLKELDQLKKFISVRLEHNAPLKP